MISDVLADAVQEIDRYLSDPAYQEVYQGGLRTRILLVRHAMEVLREELETPPELSGHGIQIGVHDCHGHPIHLGDTLRFYPEEWGGPCEFIIDLKNGELVHPGSTSDLTQWCEVIACPHATPPATETPEA